MYTTSTTDVLVWEKVPEAYRSSLSNSTMRELEGYPADWPELEFLSLSPYTSATKRTRTTETRMTDSIMRAWSSRSWRPGRGGR